MTAPVISVADRIRRVRQEPRRRALTVQQVRRLSPQVQHISFTGEDLADFASHAFDDHVKLFLPAADGGEPVARDYTPRRFDASARRLCIEFALHGDGPAAQWAAQAQPGDALVIGGPRGSFVLPDDLAWHLLVGDLSALPAIARRLEALPPSAEVTAVVQAEPADRRVLRMPPRARLVWVDDLTACLAALRDWQRPAGEGFAWCAGEAQAMREVRRQLLDQGLDPRAVRAAAYWRPGAAGHHERLGDAG